jgi:hypothetical protein
MRKEPYLKPEVVVDSLNLTGVGKPRTVDRTRWNMHVSDVLESDGPRAFCPRYNVLAFYSNRERVQGKITPARDLLFATGHFMGEFVVSKFLRNSPYRGSVFANWSCNAWKQYVNDDDHDRYEDTFDNVIGQQRVCKCGRKIQKHNELDLVLPSLRLTGHPDLILLHNGVFYVHEFKSMDRKDISFDDLRIPLSSHTLQVTFYYKMLRYYAKTRGKGERVSRRLVVDYIDRSNSKLFAGYPYKALVTAPVADEYMTKYLNKLKHAVGGIKTRKLPPRICPEPSTTRAKNCDLAVECFGRRKMFLPKPEAIIDGS